MTITLHGINWDKSSSFMRGAAEGPAVIREHLFSDVSSPFALSGADISALITEMDFAASPDNGEAARADITARISQSIKAGNRPLSLGGDHSVTFPILSAIRAKHGPVNILHVDAHPDLYADYEGDLYSHASPFRRAIEAGYVNTLVQVGLRSVTPACREFGAANNVVMLGAEAVDQIPWNRLTDPLYMSIDLDGIDPAYAPGVAHPEPGGLTSREVIGMIHRLPAAPVGADVVEYNPGQDIRDLTAHLAVRLVKELAAKMAE